MPPLFKSWFVYAGGFGGDTLDPTNYFHINFFPACQTTGPYICVVAADYIPSTYGVHPSPYSFFSNLRTYIIDARATWVAQPSGLGQVPYVYVSSFP